MTKKIMKLINERTGEMECKVCLQRHFASVNSNTGFYFRGYWQCHKGCKLD